MSSNSKENQTEGAILKIIREKTPQSIRQLSEIAKEELKISEREIIEAILKLQSEGKITFREELSVPPEIFASYLKTGDALWYWTTIITAAATALVVFTIPENAYPIVYIRYVLGVIFVLWLPGYSFIKALFPRQAPIKTPTETLDTVERIALSLGMSIALVPIVGLILNYTPWGIRLTPIVLSLLALTAVFSTVAVIREHRARKTLKG